MSMILSPQNIKFGYKTLKLNTTLIIALNTTIFKISKISIYTFFLINNYNKSFVILKTKIGYKILTFS